MALWGHSSHPEQGRHFLGAPPSWLGGALLQLLRSRGVGRPAAPPENTATPELDGNQAPRRPGALDIPGHSNPAALGFEVSSARIRAAPGWPRPPTPAPHCSGIVAPRNMGLLPPPAHPRGQLGAPITANSQSGPPTLLHHHPGPRCSSNSDAGTWGPGPAARDPKEPLGGV